MTTSRIFCWPVWVWIGLAAVAMNWGEANASAADFKVRAQLIWGTDDAKPTKPYVKELDPKLRSKLRLLKWRNYFEIKDPRFLDNQTFSLATGVSKRVRISELCEIEVKHLGGSNIEVKLIGEGRLVQKVSQALPKGEYLFLAGNVKEKTNEAWIVALSAIDE